MAAHDKNTDKNDICVLTFSNFIFYKAYFSWKRKSGKILAPVGLTHIQYVFLCILQSLEFKRQQFIQNDLPRLTDYDVTMTCHILRSLQKLGLLEHKHIDGDERAKYSTLLPDGKQLIKKAEKIMDKFEQEYFAPINCDDFMQCLKNLTAGQEACQ